MYVIGSWTIFNKQKPSQMPCKEVKIQLKQTLSTLTNEMRGRLCPLDTSLKSKICLPGENKSN